MCLCKRVTLTNFSFAFRKAGETFWLTFPRSSQNQLEENIILSIPWFWTPIPHHPPNWPRALSHLCPGGFPPAPCGRRSSWRTPSAGCCSRLRARSVKEATGNVDVTSDSKYSEA